MDRLKDSQTSLGQIQVSELHKWQYYEGFYMKLGIFGSKVLSVIQSCLFFRSKVYYLTIRCDYSPIFTSPEATNRPFPSSKKFHFQNEAKCETFVVEMSFICIIIKTHFHNKGFALSLVLKVKLFGTRKWPIVLV